MKVAAHISVVGLYLRGVNSYRPLAAPNYHSLPVHNACEPREPTGALMVLVAVQLFVLGLYLPPVLKILGRASL